VGKGGLLTEFWVFCGFCIFCANFWLFGAGFLAGFDAICLDSSFFIGTVFFGFISLCDAGLDWFEGVALGLGWVAGLFCGGACVLVVFSLGIFSGWLFLLSADLAGVESVPVWGFGWGGEGKIGAGASSGSLSESWIILVFLSAGLDYNG